jgi:tetratricopeptide (TPR) repeat protein
LPAVAPEREARGGILVLPMEAAPEPMVRQAESAAVDAEWYRAYCEHYAGLAAAQKWLDPTVLDWVQAARGWNPKDVDLAMWEALCHRHAGDFERAIAVMEEAALLAPETSGEPDYYIASFFMERTPPDPRQAIAHLERALRREPGLWEPVDLDHTFDPLGGDEKFEAMLSEATQRARTQAPSDP